MSLLIFLVWAALWMCPKEMVVLVGGAPPPKKVSDIWKDLK
jgi:hypothetical protein